METVTLYISGMACGGCSNIVANTLKVLDGVAEAEVSHAEATAEVSYDPAKVTVAQLKAAVEAAGYKVAA